MWTTLSQPAGLTAEQRTTNRSSAARARALRSPCAAGSLPQRARNLPKEEEQESSEAPGPCRAGLSLVG